MDNYWDNRYKTGGNSGLGSYGENAKYKANIINTYINKFRIKTICDFGCGDGNQISLFEGFDKYFGCDISLHALSICEEKFKNNGKMTFLS